MCGVAGGSGSTRVDQGLLVRGRRAGRGLAPTNVEVGDRPREDEAQAAWRLGHRAAHQEGIEGIRQAGGAGRARWVNFEWSSGRG